MLLKNEYKPNKIQTFSLLSVTNPATPRDLPLLDLIVGAAPTLFTLTGANETAEQFFSNSGQNGTWQDLYNRTLDAVLQVSEYLDCVRLDRFEAFDTEEVMIQTGSEFMSNGKVWAGIVFNNIHKDMAEVPKHVNYKLRMNTGMESKNCPIMFLKEGSISGPEDYFYFSSTIRVTKLKCFSQYERFSYDIFNFDTNFFCQSCILYVAGSMHESLMSILFFLALFSSLIFD